MATRTQSPKAPVAVQAADAEKVDTAVTLSKPAATERLVQVLMLIDKTTVKDITTLEATWGKAVGLVGGGSVYINRSNADVRSTQKQVAEWAKSIKGSSVRGAQGQYLRIAF